jgi:hypothetical protein
MVFSPSASGRDPVRRQGLQLDGDDVPGIDRGRRRCSTPGLIGLFTIGLTGLFLASLGVDVHVTDTYFVVAHFHYIMVGGAIMAYLGGLHYWWPKISGRLYPEIWARVASVILFVGFNLTFFPQFVLGYLAPRRYHGTPNQVSTRHQRAHRSWAGYVPICYLCVLARRSPPTQGRFVSRPTRHRRHGAPVTPTGPGRRTSIPGPPISVIRAPHPPHAHQLQARAPARGVDPGMWVLLVPKCVLRGCSLPMCRLYRRAASQRHLSARRRQHGRLIQLFAIALAAQVARQ